MSDFSVHTIQSASAQSSELLSEADAAYGFVPNLFGVLAVSRFNDCRYCMAAHTAIAGMQEVPEHVVKSIRMDQAIEDQRLEALRKFTTLVVEKRGSVSAQDIAAFEGAGFGRAQVLEVILAISFKTLSNYVNHVADTPLDAAFADAKWQPVT
jgi:alkylhydroperoxidase family enzyme